MNNDNTLHSLIDSAFNHAKTDDFIHLLGGHGAWHIMHNETLYIFEISLDTFDKPSIKKVAKQNDLHVNSALGKDDTGHRLINDIYIKGLHHTLFLAYSMGNLELFPDNIEKYFLYLLLDGYQPSDDYALVKCVRPRNKLEGTPVFEVKLKEFSKEFKATNLSEASQIAKRIIDEESLPYTNIIMTR
tara:strand:+ start:8837 stop:9397 length:561 start_codon:yes stop_codon:yes gene_type:complete